MKNRKKIKNAVLVYSAKPKTDTIEIPVNEHIKLSVTLPNGYDGGRVNYIFHDEPSPFYTKKYNS